MKKIPILLVAGIATLGLASCGDKEAEEVGQLVTGPVQNIKGGTVDEQQAIEDVADMSIILKSGSTGVTPEDTEVLLEDEGDYVYVVTSQLVKVNGTVYTVKLEWTSDTSNTYLSGYSTLDSTHGIFEINYPGKYGNDGALTVKLGKISCGGAHSENTTLAYNFEIKKGNWYHKDVHISELLKTKVVDEAKGLYGYDIVDYVTKPANAYYYPNPENAGQDSTKQYYYVNCFGKFIYNAPDGNWGLIADGNKVMEIYAGSALNILPTRYPALNNKYVKVVGNMSQYCGNMQIGFINEIKKATAADLEQDFTSPIYEELTAAQLANMTPGLQVVNGLNLTNALKSVKGKYVAGSVSGSVALGSRFTFKVDVGGKQLTVAYDYHVDKYGDDVDTSSMKLVIDQLKAVMANPTQEFEIKGTLRYAGSNTNPFNQTSGEYQLVPFLGEQITRA